MDLINKNKDIIFLNTDFKSKYGYNISSERKEYLSEKIYNENFSELNILLLEENILLYRTKLKYKNSTIIISNDTITINGNIKEEVIYKILYKMK